MRVMFGLQILKDEATREQYDYAIAHPEEVLFSLFSFSPYYLHCTILVDTCTPVTSTSTSTFSIIYSKPANPSSILELKEVLLCPKDWWYFL